MTTITIERALLEEAIVTLAGCSGLPHWPALVPTISDLRAALAAPATAPDELERLRAESEERLQNCATLVAGVERLHKDAERKPMTETEIVKCLVQAGCIGTVKMTFESGPYDITRPSIKADNLVREVEAFHGIKGTS